MKIPCSSCNQRLEIPEELAGQTIECPSCKASLAVPAIEVPPPATPQIRVTAPQAAKPQKPSPRRQTSAAPKAASSKKSKSPIPKWAIASLVGIIVVALLSIVFFSGGSADVSSSEAKLAKPVNPKANKALLNAVEKGEIEAAKQAIADGADVNVKDKFGFTPLHEAAGGGHKEVAELLIAAGADVNAKEDFDGGTPLDYARRHPETADLIRKHGGKTGAEL